MAYPAERREFNPHFLGKAHKYLCVGYQKRVTEALSPVFQRRVMGRKGIGKLSLFSIANDITILTSKGEEKNALRMTSDSLIRDVHQNQLYHPEELPIEKVDFEGNGTTIILNYSRQCLVIVSTPENH